MSPLLALLTDPWFEARFYGGAFEDHPCDGVDCILVDKDKPHNHSGFRFVDSIDGAQGLWLYCPCAFGDDRRAHGLIVPFANPRNAPPLPPNHGPVNSQGQHPRWQMEGAGLADLTVSPSVLVGTPGVDECWHGFIQGGIIK